MSMSSVTPDIKEIKIEKIVKPVKLPKISKAAKKVVKALSSESSSVLSSESVVVPVDTNKSLSLPQKLLSFTKHPKFKLVLLGIILIIAAVAYFKYQQKLKETKKPVSTPNVSNDASKEQSKQDLIRQQFLKQQIELAQFQQLQQAQQAHLAQAAQAAQAAQVPVSHYQPAKQTNKPKQQKKVESSEDENSSEEVLVEDQNVMKHNLTQEEMNAIDKQLEDVKLDNLNEL